VIESHLEDPEIGGGAKQQREIELLKKDPVHLISLPEFIKEILVVLQNNVGSVEEFKSFVEERWTRFYLNR
jgi:hypothetical protein